jgi:hypothetical protein
MKLKYGREIRMVKRECEKKEHEFVRGFGGSREESIENSLRELRIRMRMVFIGIFQKMKKFTLLT